MDLDTVTDWLKNAVGYVPQEQDPNAPPPDPSTSSGMNAGDLGVIAGLLGAKSLATMAGPMSKTANMRMFHEAQGNLLEGRRSLENIYNRTGWYPLREPGKMAYEIPDTGLNPRPLRKVRPGTSMEANYGNFADNPAVLKAYPQLKNYRIKIDPNYGFENEGLHEPNSSLITIGGDVREGGLSPLQQGVLTHETQHAVDKIEGRLPGGLPENMRDVARNAIHDLYYATPEGSDERAQMSAILKDFNLNADKLGYGLYRALPGEGLARNSEDRFMWDKYGRLTSKPQMSDFNETADQLAKQGFQLSRVPLKVGAPVDYTLRSINTGEILPPSALPRDLRSLYDRLPYGGSRSGALGQQMLGERKYPWKTEDLRREAQFDYRGKNITPSQMAEVLKRVRTFK